jgi:sigma-E factor negative regulatory protein RseB
VKRGLVLGAGLIVVGALAVAGLAAIGSDIDEPTATAWTGWTGRVDATSIDDRAAMTPDDASAVQLLSRAATAADSVGYSGRAVASGPAGPVTVDLVHVPGRGTLVRMSGGVAQFSPEGRSDTFADDGRALSLLRVNYRVLRQANLDGRVAGRPAAAVVALTADGDLAARYWLDKDSGLLLRKELVRGDGMVWSRSEFTTLHLGVPAGTQLPAGAADPWSERLDAAGLAAARAEGCPCPDALPGGMVLLETRRAPAGAVGPSAVLHQIFSDGLVSLSLFALTGSMTAADVDGLRDKGFTATTLAGGTVWTRSGGVGASELTVVWASHGSVLTLVSTDAVDPAATTDPVVAALPPTSEVASDGLWDRVRRGWHRLTGRSS